jgi:hypothetical protein
MSFPIISPSTLKLFCVIFLFTSCSSKTDQISTVPKDPANTTKSKVDTTLNLRKISIATNQFNNKRPFNIISFQNEIVSNSTGTDTSKCRTWKLTEKNITDIIQHSESIDGTIWDLSFVVLRCGISGILSQDNFEYKFSINAGSFFSISNSDTTLLFGDFVKDHSKYFLAKPDR